MTTFSFDVSAEKQGMNIAVTPGNDTWFSYARDLFINIPNLEIKQIRQKMEYIIYMVLLIRLQT